MVDLKLGRYGACIFNRDQPVSDTVITICPLNKNATRYMKHLGTKCVDLSLQTPASCAAFNGTWVYPSTDPSSCEEKACLEPLPDKVYGLIYLFGFSTKPFNSCIGDESNWTKVNTWESAHWADPTIRGLNWTAKNFQSVDVTDIRLRFNVKIYKYIVDGTLGAGFGSVASSAALCDFSSTKAALETVTCDCYGGTGQCFANELVPLVISTIQ